jgi:hypothetical protein
MNATFGSKEILLMMEFLKLMVGFFLGFAFIWGLSWMYFVYPWSQVSLKSFFIGLGFGVCAGIITAIIIAIYNYHSEL